MYDSMLSESSKYGDARLPVPQGCDLDESIRVGAGGVSDGMGDESAFTLEGKAVDSFLPADLTSDLPSALEDLPDPLMQNGIGGVHDEVSVDLARHSHVPDFGMGMGPLMREDGMVDDRGMQVQMGDTHGPLERLGAEFAGLDSHRSLFQDDSEGLQQQQQHRPEMMMWCYQDPQGSWQGPFSSSDILNWFDKGFFPLDLPMRAATVSDGGPTYITVLREIISSLKHEVMSMVTPVAAPQHHQRVQMPQRPTDVSDPEMSISSQARGRVYTLEEVEEMEMMKMEQQSRELQFKGSGLREEPQQIGFDEPDMGQSLRRVEAEGYHNFMGEQQQYHPIHQHDSGAGLDYFQVRPLQSMTFDTEENRAAHVEDASPDLFITSSPPRNPATAAVEPTSQYVDHQHPSNAWNAGGTLSKGHDSQDVEFVSQHNQTMDPALAISRADEAPVPNAWAVREDKRRSQTFASAPDDAALSPSDAPTFERASEEDDVPQPSRDPKDDGDWQPAVTKSSKSKKKDRQSKSKTTKETEHSPPGAAVSSIAAGRVQDISEVALANTQLLYQESKEASPAATMASQKRGVAGWSKTGSSNESSNAGKSLIQIQQEEEENRRRETKLAEQLEEQMMLERSSSMASNVWNQNVRARLQSAPRQPDVVTGASPGDGDSEGMFWDFAAPKGHVGHPQVSPSLGQPPPLAWSKTAAGPEGHQTPSSAFPSLIGQPASSRVVKAAPAASEGKGAKDSGRPSALENSGASGVPMTPEFRDWCESQMSKLTGDDDLTLIEFLMSLDSSGEIAEYIKTYLGATPVVSSFITEFIRRKAKESTKKAIKKKELKNTCGEPTVEISDNKAHLLNEKRVEVDLPPQQQGESGAGQAPGKKKQKGKKRVVDPSLLGFSVTSSRIMQGEIELPGA